MRDRSNAGMSWARGAEALLGLLAALALGAPSWAEEIAAVDDSQAAVAAKAQASASELAVSLRSLDGSLLAAAPAPEGNRVLSAAEHDALVEAAVKAQIAALANELDVLSASLAADSDPLIQNALLDRVAQRASVLSRLGARPARVPIPQAVTSELLALWSDVEALHAKRRTATSPSDPLDSATP